MGIIFKDKKQYSGNGKLEQLTHYVTITDANTNNFDGNVHYYMALANECSNVPIATSSWYIIETNYNNEQSVQIAIQLTGVSTWIRRRNGVTWSSWYETWENTVHNKLYYHYEPITNPSTTTAMKWNAVMFEMAKKIKAVLHTIPSGYYVCLEQIRINAYMCNVQMKLWGTSGGSSSNPNVNLVALYNSVTGSGIHFRNWYLSSETESSNIYDNFVTTTNTAATFSNLSNDDCIAKSDSMPFAFWYRVYKQTSTDPTE